jgi:hypothetical protein
MKLTILVLILACLSGCVYVHTEDRIYIENPIVNLENRDFGEFSEIDKE